MENVMEKEQEKNKQIYDDLVAWRNINMHTDLIQDWGLFEMVNHDTSPHTSSRVPQMLIDTAHNDDN